jgi:ferredoxin-NADP reductase
MTPRQARVVQLRWEADGVMSLRLRSDDGEPLPSWTPGAHIDLVLPSGAVRQYSLCGRPDAAEYTVAVLREQQGRGGSAEIHDTALLGRRIGIGDPRNRFELETAARYVFVAGGIGITPLLAMIRAVVARGVPWDLYYGGRRAGTLAFTGELDELAALSGGRVHTFHQDRDGDLPLGRIVTGAAEDAVLYACGPAGMLTAIEDTVRGIRPQLPLRIERFTADPAVPTADPADGDTAAGDREFEVELARTGETVRVRPGQSVLDAVRERRPDVLSSCEEGFCGTCETKVVEGEPIHRDTILSAKERARNTSMMICVGSCASSRLVLDL